METKNRKIKGVQRITSFYGPRCVGLDSGALVSLIYNEEAFQKCTNVLNDSLFNFTHERCVGKNNEKIKKSEVFQVLTSKKKRYQLGTEEAIDKIKKFLQKYKIGIIPRGTNQNLVKSLYFKGKEKNIPV
ncbi:unnamed protein product, partial [marine sediment metagenome]